MRPLLPAFALALAGCLGSASPGPADLAAVRDLAGTSGDLAGDPIDLAATPGDLAMGGGDLARPYPAGPYGNRAGDTLPPLLWEGYVNDAADAVATTRPFGPYSMDALRTSGRPYALIHVSEFG